MKKRHPRSYPKIFSNGKWRDAHRVVMEEFLERSLDRSEAVHHINGDITDFRIENLDIMLLQEHTRAHKIGHRNQMAKLSEREVIEIRSLLDMGESRTSIAEKFGVHPSIIGKIKNRVIWAHVA